MIELLKDLSSTFGPCGFEEEVAMYIAKRLKGKVDEIEVDGIGNLIVKKKGTQPGPKIVIAAHMDEVGFIVKKIEENGLIRFEKLGGHDDRILLSQRVQVRTSQGFLTGVIGTISAHMMKFDQPEKVRKHQQLYIDVGVASKQEAEAIGVEIGNPIVWYPHFDLLTDKRVSGKAFDDRAGCAVLIKALEELSKEDFKGEIIGAFTVQEEVGLRGARVVSHQHSADVAIALDTTAVSDTPEEMMDNTLALGNGTGIKVLDFSLIANQKVCKHLTEIAKTNQITYQLEVFPGIGTDAGELTMANNGIPTSTLSIPSRYAHASIEVLDLRDLEATKDLLVAFIKEMNPIDSYKFTIC